ncbi:MAG: hypothetical protein MPK62_01285 [Alphaproteobacteria bacterium]|nr:hypothetical protein [Alphaproteobacteria bacterium]MDA8029768.1 hypothetical protein [Alphaproteobacteria bacterium]
MYTIPNPTLEKLKAEGTLEYLSGSMYLVTQEVRIRSAGGWVTLKKDDSIILRDSIHYFEVVQK